MGLFKNLFGKFKSTDPNILPQTPTSEWTGVIASLIEYAILNKGLDMLALMAVSVDRRNNRPTLRGGQNGSLPDMSNDHDVLVFCYLKDVPTFAENTAMIRKMIDLETKENELIARALGEKSELLGRGGLWKKMAMVDQIALHAATELEKGVELRSA